MTAIFASLLSAFPTIFMSIIGRVVTQQFMQVVITKILIFGLSKAADMTSNTLTHEIVADVIVKLRTEPVV